MRFGNARSANPAASIVTPYWMHRSRRSRKSGRSGLRVENIEVQFLVSSSQLPVGPGLELGKAQKKRPELFSSGRPGSPPPELPNHEMDTRACPFCCKRHFGNPQTRTGHMGNGGSGNALVTSPEFTLEVFRFEFNPLIVMENAQAPESFTYASPLPHRWWSRFRDRRWSACRAGRR